MHLQCLLTVYESSAFATILIALQNMWRTLSCKPNTSFCTQMALEWLPRPIVWVEEATVALRKSSSAGVKASQDKTSQQEKEKDKWRRRKNVLVWRGLLKPLPQAHREEQEQPWGWDPSQQFVHGSNTCAGAYFIKPTDRQLCPWFLWATKSKASPLHLSISRLSEPGNVFSQKSHLRYWKVCGILASVSTKGS